MSQRSVSERSVRWPDHVEPLVLAVRCDGSTHHIRWERGEVVLDDHQDVDAELALMAFGGAELPCLTLLSLWSDAIADGGFLGEWVEGDLDDARLWWLGMALERMRNEGFHEFLRDLPLARANRMGQFLTRFPGPWLDRAAAHVSELLVDGDGIVCDRAPGLIPIAVARRLRRAFVLSVGGRQIAIGAAALVPFRPIVGVGVEPSVEGVIRGRSSWAKITVDQRWLFDVWGSDASVVDGHLVLAIDHEHSLALVVDWSDEPISTPLLVQRPIDHDGEHWHVEPR